MRNEFRDTIAEVMVQSDSTFFLTGDLGYNALEKVRDCAGARFINAGVAEQSMVGVAAGIASLGNEAFVYSIAPFVTFRCLEQVRLDVCIHNLPVYIVGNGGGYGYGIMGATHHAIEDVGSVSALDNMVCWIPAFADDVAPCVHAIRSERRPAYLRLGMGRNRPEASETFSAVSCVNRGSAPNVTVLTMGPVISNVIDAVSELECAAVADVFSVARIPFDGSATAKIVASLQKTQKLLIVEEHVTRGGLAEYVLTVLADAGCSEFTTHRLYAKGYPNKLYGSQQYHQTMSGLDAKSISSLLRAIL
jgi:transketolase